MDVTAAAPPKKRGLSSRGQQAPESTNVSSPTSNVTKKKRAPKKKRVVEDDASEDNVNTHHDKGYRRDGFVVSDHVGDQYLDDEDEDMGFEPVRIAARPTKQTKRRLGPPITMDERLESLDPRHRLVVEDFVAHANRESNKIQMSKGLRQTPFSETILREMAISFPKTSQELLEIPGIDADRVKLYSKTFLKIIKQHKDNYDELLHEDEEKPHDPNHKVDCIDLVSSDEEARRRTGNGGEVSGGEEEEDYSELEYSEDEEEEEEEEEEQSRHFSQPNLRKPPTTNFNEQYLYHPRETSATKPSRSRALGADLGRQPKARSGSGVSRASKTSVGFNSRTSGGGVTKRKNVVAGGSGGRTSGGAGKTTARSGGGQSGAGARANGTGDRQRTFVAGGGISMMPT